MALKIFKRHQKQRQEIQDIIERARLSRTSWIGKILKKNKADK